MQLGTRWAVGDPHPERLPEVVGIAIDTVEGDLATAGIATEGWRWTLTWLEGRPVVELDDGTVIRYDTADDSATITQPSTGEPDEFDET